MDGTNEIINNNSNDKIIVYDSMGTHYFLVLHRADLDTWEFPNAAFMEGKEPEQVVFEAVRQATGISQMRIAQRIEHAGMNVYAVEASMNVPVVIASQYDNYLWGTFDRVSEKLAEAERLALTVANEKI